MERVLGALDVEGPEDGHTFHFDVSIRGSNALIGEDHHTDSTEFWPGFSVEVRAWNLSDACKKAGALPLNTWTYEGEV